FIFFFQAEDGIRDGHVTGVQTCALPISALLPGGDSLTRARYQEGCLTRAKRKSGDVWEFRFRERQPDGTKRMRCVVIGTVAQYRDRKSVVHQIEVLRANVNREAVTPETPVLTTFKSLVDHYRLTELKMDSHVKKSYSTKKRTATYLGKWI